MYNLPRLKYEEIENMNRQTNNNQIERVIKKLPPNRSPGPDYFTVKSTTHFKKSQYSFFSNYSKTLKRKEHFQTHFIRPALSCSKTRQRHQKQKQKNKKTKKTGQVNIIKEHRCKSHQQNIRKLNSTID